VGHKQGMARVFGWHGRGVQGHTEWVAEWQAEEVAISWEIVLNGYRELARVKSARHNASRDRKSGTCPRRLLQRESRPQNLIRSAELNQN
jgi:hypothetical protein